MKLTTRIFRIFTFIFVAQLAGVGILAYMLYSSDDKYPASVISSLTKVDKSILEGIILQNKMGSPVARDLVAYRLLELNNIDNVLFIPASSLSKIISDMKLRDCLVLGEVTVCSKSDQKVVLSLMPLMVGTKVEGYLKLEKSLKVAEELNKKVLFTIALTVLVVFFINLFALIMIWSRFLKPETNRLLRVFESGEEDKSIQVMEYQQIQNSFLNAVSKVKLAETEKVLLESKLQIINLATQVAHDIRSPLEALKSLKDELSMLPDSSRKSVQISINRIEEITFNLLKKHKQSIKTDDELKPQELLGLITSVVVEKNIEYRNYPDLEIATQLDSISYGHFSKIQRNTLKNILSNLINNGIESCQGKSGSVMVSLVTEGDRNVISVKDSGPGVSASAQGNLFKKGFTTKGSGNGLGLYNAKKEIEAVGGTIEFYSEVGQGATFTISLPKSETTSLFIGKFDTGKYERIIILDDDPAFHEVWNKRLIGLEHKVEHVHSVEEMFFKYPVLNSKTLLLSDFDLMDKHDGIDVILKLTHAPNSVLVTARSEEIAIQERCLKNGIKLIPKSLVNYIKVTDTFPESSIVLIDDDRLVHLNWSHSCKNRGLHFIGFKSIDEFLTASSTITKASNIYIDSNLGEGIKGEIEAEKIYNIGFLNLYLTTGYEKDSFQKPVWIKEIYSKSLDEILS
jgi:signal transduction histidine kinase/CheY-like chemotaxis protein